MIRKSRNDDVLARMRAANPFSATKLWEGITDAELSRASGCSERAATLRRRDYPVRTERAMTEKGSPEAKAGG